MKAIILAAGFGRRMRPLTDQTHKTLLRVGSKTIIQRIVESLEQNGIFDIVIVTGYRAEELKQYLLKEFPHFSFTFIHNPRFEETNNIYSMSLALQSIAINEDIILIESDLIFEPRVLKRLIDSTFENVALVDQFRSGMDGTVVTVENSLITNIIPPHLQGPNFNFLDKYKSLNIYKFSKDFCNTTFKRLLEYYAKFFDDNCYYELILGILIYVQREVIHAEILADEKWIEIDDPNDLALAQFMFDFNHKFEILENNFGGLWNYDTLDFCYLRNMYFPNDSIIAELKNNLEHLIHNYGTKQDVLNQKLAYVLLYDKENLNVFNGISQIYPLLKIYWQGQRVLIPSPTFGEYPRVFGDNVSYSDHVGIDLAEIEEKSRNSDVIVFVNPNNPTGSVIPSEKIFDFARSNKEKIILVDESFIEFSGQPSMITILKKYPIDNVIVIKSLSKSFGIPGLRLGYAYSCNRAFHDYIVESLPIWNLNSVVEYFMEIILKHRESLAQSFVKTIADREHFFLELRKLDFLESVFPSAGNFILISFKKNLLNLSHIADNLLLKYSIYVKNISHKFNDGHTYLRLAVRLPKENDYFIKCLKNCILDLHR